MESGIVFRAALRVPVAALSLMLILFTGLSDSQTAPEATVPRLVRFAGIARDLSGKPLSGVVGVTFALYAEQTGGAALWMETQNVQADAAGHYSVLLGSTKPDGLPPEIFASEQARWIGVQIGRGKEQPRTLLVSAPYALKAGDAETLGGLPPSAFVRTTAEAAGNSAPVSGTPAPGSAAGAANLNAAATPATTKDVTTTGGTVNAIPLFTTATNIQKSVLSQSGTKIGVNKAAPAYTLDVAGSIGIANNKNSTASADRLYLASGDSSHYIYSTGTGGNSTVFGEYGGTFHFYDTESDADRMTIAFGNVGINNTVPVKPLDVDGVILAAEGVPDSTTCGAGTGGYSFENDGCWDTGIFSPSDGVLDLYTNSVQAMTASGGYATFPVGADFGTPTSTNSTLFAKNIGGSSFAFGIKNFGTPGDGSFDEAQFDVNGKATFYTDELGDTVALGTKSAAVPLAKGEMVKVFSTESPEVWFEDYGFGRLFKGAGKVTIDPNFLETVSAQDYHVFVTPKGDCKGLYVTNETGASFEVRELNGGQSDVAFDYRIVAHRKGYESVRLPVAKMPVLEERPKAARK